MIKPLGRRAFLRGAMHGVPVAVGLPALEAMLDCNGTALAALAGEPLPRRFGVWFSGGGVGNESFYPTTVGPNWQPSDALSPLVNVKDHVTVVSGADMKRGGLCHNSHRGHCIAASWTTNRTLNGLRYGDPTEPSLDQIVAVAWTGKTRFDSIELGVAGNQPYQMSFKRGLKIMPKERNPTKVYDRLFGGGVVGGGGAAGSPTKVLLDSHKSVLDVTMASARRLAARVGAVDRSRLDAHYEAIREIEKRLGTVTTQTPGASGCTASARPTLMGTGSGARQEFDAVNRAQADLLVLALACDLTRVFSFQWCGAQPFDIFWVAGTTQEHHPMSHSGAYQGVAAKMTKFVMGQLAYLIEKLKATREGDGSLLDRTLVYYTNEFLDASRHSKNSHPIMLIGKAGGAVKSGIHLKATGENMTKAMVAAVNAVGVTVPGIGDKGTPLYASEPLPGLLT